MEEILHYSCFIGPGEFMKVSELFLENAKGLILYFLLSSVQLLCLTAQNLQPQGNLVHPALGVNSKVASQQWWV